MRMTLKEWKEYFFSTYSTQRGPYDAAGWERDRDRRQAIRRARTWAALVEAVPSDYVEAAINRCRKSDL